MRAGSILTDDVLIDHIGAMIGARARIAER
jgi:hypothetical protein